MLAPTAMKICKLMLKPPNAFASCGSIRIAGRPGIKRYFKVNAGQL